MMEEKTLTLFEHLSELRQRLIKSLIAVAVGTIIAYVVNPTIFNLLLVPSNGTGLELIATEMPEIFGSVMKVSFIGGVIIAMPVLVYQLVMFVGPGLTTREKRFFALLMPGIVVAFLTGVSFAYFLVLPRIVEFFLSFGADFAKPQIRISNYVSVVSDMLLWSGITFETPIIIFFLAKIRIVNSHMLSRFRRHAVVVAFIIAAIITPTVDPVTQLIVAVPIIILYEASILLTKLA